MQTSREFETLFPELSREDQIAASRQRNASAQPVLKALLKPGDKIRATKAECCAREATFTFAGWEGKAIISKSGLLIAPGSVYSINGEIQRF